MGVAMKPQAGLFGEEIDYSGQTSPQFMDFPPYKFDIIYTDPPWDYKGQTQHAGKKNNDTGSALKHYPTIELSKLKTLRVSNVAAKNSLLFMWATSPHLDQAIDLGKAWGFEYATVAFVWDKIRVNPGFYTMSQCELCLLFKRGKIPSPRGARNIMQLVTSKRTRHSEKPKEVRDRIDALFPTQRKIELFARGKMPKNWHGWGLETEADHARQDNQADSGKKPGSRSNSARRSAKAHGFRD